jgi:alpha-beta hydrolase superfamily lysophospholipase
MSSIDWTRPYDVHGHDSDAPLVLLLHDTTGTRHSHAPTTAALVQNGYRVLTMDLPAHGSRWDQPLNRASSVAAVKEVIDAEVSTKRSILQGSVTCLRKTTGVAGGADWERWPYDDTGHRSR